MRRYRLAGVVLMCSLAGIMYLVQSGAATYSRAVEAESGIRAGNVSVVANASGSDRPDYFSCIKTGKLAGMGGKTGWRPLATVFGN